MSGSEDRRRKSPVDRFRKILAAEQEQLPAGEAHRHAVLNLPKAGAIRGPVRPPATRPTEGAASEKSPRPPRRWLPIFWTIASTVSVVINVILLGALIMVGRNLGLAGAAARDSSLLGGLYDNFERMDQAHIRTNIPLQTSVPLNLVVPVQTTTTITLTDDAAIRGAHVRINTALFNIDAPASVTLPAGTSMSVALNMSLPVQGEIPVAVSVPVDIPLQDTDLHPALVGLQDTIRPLYCLVDPSARTIDGARVCR